MLKLRRLLRQNIAKRNIAKEVIQIFMKNPRKVIDANRVKKIPARRRKRVMVEDVKWNVIQVSMQAMFRCTFCFEK